MSAAPLSIAVVGAGWVTAARHIPVLLRNDGFRVVGLVDCRPQRIERTLRQHKLPNAAVAARLADVPWIDQVQAVSIGAEPAAHYALCREALERGLHVIMEKPMTLRPSEAQELVELAARRRCVLCIVHNFQFTRSFLELRRRIDTGRLGQITGIAATQLSSERRRLPTWYEELPWGLFYDESPHLLYLLRALYPRLELAESTVWPSRLGRQTPSLVTAHYRAPGGPPLFLYMNFDASISEWHFIVYGSERTAAVDVFRDILVELPCDHSHAPRDILRTSLAGAWSHFKGVFLSGLGHLRGTLLYGNPEVFGRFLAAVRGDAPAEPVTGADGLAVCRMQHELMARARAISAAPAAPPEAIQEAAAR